MDSQLFQTLQDRFDSIDRQLTAITKSIGDHIEKDEEYWRRLDDQKAQLRLIKWIGGTGVGSSFILWALNKLHIL